MKTNKKAQGGVPWELKDMILVLLVVFIVGAIFYKYIAASSKPLDTIKLNSMNDLCQLSGKRILDDNKVLNEAIEVNKGDGFPDDCDICLGGNNKAISNSYGIPDDCFAEPALNQKIKTYKDMCKARNGCYISDTDQCCIGDAKGRCGSKCK